jgi:hypothetical protein
MQHPTPTTGGRVAIRSPWIDRVHHHQRVALIQIPGRHHVRVRAVRGLSQQPSGHLETVARRAGRYHPAAL